MRNMRRSPDMQSASALFFDWTKFLFLCGILIWLTVRGSEDMGYNWQWYRVPRFLWWDNSPGLLLQGLWVTLKITAASFWLAFGIGLLTAVFRLSNSFAARWIARGYLELIRNTPLLIQLFVIYFVIAPIMDFSAFFSAVLALSLFEGAYASEIFRAGILSVDKGQWEAARGHGLSTGQSYVYVILPQAVKRILPPLTSQAVSLIKDSALVSTIAVYDLTMQGQAIAAETFLTFEIWFTVAAIYLCITMSLSGLVMFMEKRFTRS